MQYNSIVNVDFLILIGWFKEFGSDHICGVEGKRWTLWSKCHEFEPTSCHKTCAVDQ